MARVVLIGEKITESANLKTKNNFFFTKYAPSTF